MTLHTFRRTLFPLALILMVGAAPAQAQLFDFEGETATFVSPPAGARPGALTTLSILSGGVTLTVTRENGTAFDIVSNTGNQADKPPAWGNNSLDPFFAPGDDGWILDFSVPLTSLSIDFGDYGVPDTDNIIVQAFTGLGGTGALVDTANDTQTVSFPLAQTISVSSVTAFQSVVITGTSSEPLFNNSVFLDNVSVVAAGASNAPEPGTLALLGVGVGLMGLLARRKR